MNQQRIIGSIVIILGGLIMFPFLGIQKCHIDQKDNLLKHKLRPDRLILSPLKSPLSPSSYVLQVASYNNTKNLRKFIKELKKMKLQPLIQQTQKYNGVMYRVLLKGNSYEHLSALSNDLKDKFKIHPLIIQMYR